MSNKKSFIGKLFTITTTAAAIGGVCYIYRDKIKESKFFKTSVNKLSNFMDQYSSKKNYEDDDFYFDDEDEEFDNLFSESQKQNREYTSISINSTEEETSPYDQDTQSNIPTINKEDQVDLTNSFENIELQKEEMPFDSEEPTFKNVNTTLKQPDYNENTIENHQIPTIPFSNDLTNKSLVSEQEGAVLGYEYENLSDVYEDPDVLEETDKLDF